MLVSFITPCYNLKNYITDTYRSIVAQTHTQWEWVIVDDASTDNTTQIIEAFADPRIRLLRSPVNTGNLSILRNMGAREAKAEFFAFVDGDDLCEPRKLEVQLELFKRHPSMAWNHTGIRILEEETGQLVERKNPEEVKEITSPEEAFGHLAYRNFVCVSTAVIRREVFTAVGGFDEKYHRCEDINLWLRLSGNGHAMGYCDEPLLRYRVRKSGLYVSKTLEYLNMNFEVFKEIQRAFPQISDRHRDSINRHLSNVHLKIALRLLDQRTEGSSQHFRKAYNLAPSFKKLMWLTFSRFVPGVLRVYIKDKLH